MALSREDLEARDWGYDSERFEIVAVDGEPIAGGVEPRHGGLIAGASGLALACLEARRVFGIQLETADRAEAASLESTIEQLDAALQAADVEIPGSASPSPSADDEGASRVRESIERRLAADPAPREEVSDLLTALRASMAASGSRRGSAS